MKEPIILLGGGGHCKSCIDVIRQEGRFDIIGITDKMEKIGQYMADVPIIGTDDDLEKLMQNCKNFFVTVGHIQSPDIRIRLFDRLIRLGAHLPVIISPHAAVSKRAEIGPGTIVMHHALINTEAVIGHNCIINSGALIEHESRVGDHSHISTYAVLNGQCVVGSSCFVGSGTILSNNISLADNTLLSAGSVVLKSIEKSGTYIGNPLRKIR